MLVGGAPTHQHLIVKDAEGRTMLEVELSTKSRTQYTDLFRGMYEAVAAGRFDEVQYPVPSWTAWNRIRRLVLEAGTRAMEREAWGLTDNCWDPQGRSRPVEQWLEVITFDPQFDLNSGPIAY